MITFTPLTPWKSGCVAMRTILPPDSPANSWSLNCWDIVHGIKSPEALFPLDKLFMMEVFEISPSRHTFHKKIKEKVRIWKLHTWTTCIKLANVKNTAAQRDSSKTSRSVSSSFSLTSPSLVERQTDSRGHKESPTLPLKDANTATPNLIQTKKLTQTLTLTWKRRVTLRLKRTLRHVHKSGIQVGHKLWLWLWSRDTLWRVHKEASYYINVLEERLKTSDLIICLILNPHIMPRIWPRKRSSCVK